MGFCLLYGDGVSVGRFGLHGSRGSRGGGLRILKPCCVPPFSAFLTSLESFKHEARGLRVWGFERYMVQGTEASLDDCKSCSRDVHAYPEPMQQMWSSACRPKQDNTYLTITYIPNRYTYR